MKRREFFTASAAASLGVLTGCTTTSESGTNSPQDNTRPVLTLAGTPLEALREKYRSDLFDEYLPFWMENGMDHELGGAMHGMDHDGSLVHTDKFHWFQGREVFVLSYLYNHLDPNPEYLEIARKTMDFMLKHFPEEPGSVMWNRRVSREGEVLEGPMAEDPFGCYFGVEGMLELARATGDEELRDQALEFYKGISRFIHSDAVDHEAFNTYMVDLQIGTDFLRVWDDPEVEAMTERAVNVIMNRFYNPEIRMFNEKLHNDFSRIDEERTKANPGHGVEIMWMVMFEALRLRDQQLYDLAAERMMQSLEAGWDFIHDGIVHYVNVGEPCYDWGYEQPMGMPDRFYGTGEYHYMKSLWSVSEALVATLNMAAVTGDEGARRYFGMNQKCLDEKFSLRPHGFPQHMAFTDREISFRPNTARKENYHYPRMLMYNLRTMDRLIENEGRPLGYSE